MILLLVCSNEPDKFQVLYWKKWNHVPLNMGRFLSYFIIFAVMNFLKLIAAEETTVKIKKFH